MTHLSEQDASVFIGSIALMDALHATVVEHLSVVETDGPEGPYIWCACGWRSDNFGPNDSPGQSYAVHLSNALHAAAVKAMQPIVARHRAEAAREALLSAADAIDEFFAGGDPAYDITQQYLRDRAAQIGSGS